METPGLVYVNGSEAAGSLNATELQRDPLLAAAEVVLLAVVLATALLGNGLVLMVLLRRRKRKQQSPLHRFMLHLCVADLVVALFQVLPQLVWDVLGRFPGPDLVCRLMKYLQVLGMFASSYMIVAMTVDRHYAICRPLQAHRSGAPQRWNRLVGAAWSLSLLLSLPQVFIFSRSEVAPGVYECWGSFTGSWGLKVYVTWMTLAIFLIPVLVITYCQVQIFREIYHNLHLKSEPRSSAAASLSLKTTESTKTQEGKERGAAGGAAAVKSRVSLSVSISMFSCQKSPAASYYPSTPHHLPLESAKSHPSGSQRETRVSEQADPRAPSAVWSTQTAQPPLTRGGQVTTALSKTVRMTLVIVVVYSVCWAPFFGVQLWAAWHPDPPKRDVAFTLLMLLASLNSCTNPWIYSAFSSSVSPELRLLLLLLLCRGSARRRASLPPDSNTTHTSNS